MNRLLFGDNLKWLQDKNLFPDASVDLEYLDPPAWPKPLPTAPERSVAAASRRGEGPPFNSNANYNVLFKESSGADSQAQFHAFTDTWEWTADVDATYHQFLDTCPNASVVEPCPERSRRMVEALKKPSSEGRLRDEAASFRLPKGDVRGHEHHQFLKPSPTRRAMSFSAQTSPMMCPPLRPARLTFAMQQGKLAP